MHSGSHDSGVHGSPCVTPRSYLTKYEASTVTQSSQFYLTKLGDEIIAFWPLDLVLDMPRTKCEVV